MIKSYEKSLVIFIAFILVLEVSAGIFAFNKPPWGDEEHFVNTVRLFASNLDLETLRTYPEMSTPLPFIIYSFWGGITSLDLNSLRILSIIIAVATYLIFHYLLFSMTKKPLVSLAGAVFLSINPYMVGLSVFVFTDMLAILFLLLSFFFYMKKNWWAYAITTAAALLCRQYAIFLVAANFALILIAVLKTRGISRDTVIQFISNVVSLLPMLMLFLFWGGASPNSNLNDLYLYEAFTFHLSFFYLYITLLFLYLLPIVIILFKYFYLNLSKKGFLLFLLVSQLYWISPVGPSVPSINAGFLTVGYFHKLLKTVMHSLFLEQVVFYICFVFALPLLFFILKDIVVKFKEENFNEVLLIDFLIVCFLLIMPFSYLCWEKYFLLLLPFVIMRFLMVWNRSDTVYI